MQNEPTAHELFVQYNNFLLLLLLRFRFQENILDSRQSYIWVKTVYIKMSISSDSALY